MIPSYVILDIGAEIQWNNGKDGRDFTRERLHRVVANKEWCELHPDMEVIVEACLSSYHNPLYVSIHSRRSERSGHSSFRYEATWGIREECKRIVKQVWREKAFRSDKWRNLHVRMKWCKQKLMKWQATNRMISEKIIQQKTHQLAELQEGVEETDMHQARGVQHKLHSLLEQEELR